MSLSHSAATLADRMMTWIYEKSNGRFGSRVGKMDMLILYTIGRKSGEKRSHTLQYMADGDAYIVVASNSGEDHHPGWYYNLLSNPQVNVQIGRSQRAMQASIADSEEYARLWPRLIAQNPPWEAYSQRTSRKIPVVILRSLAENS